MNRNFTSIIIIILLTTILGCKQATNRDIGTSVKSVNLQKSTADSVSILSNDLAAENPETSIQSTDCTRGVAESIINKSVFPNSNFQLQKDSLTAIETVDFDNGDKLLIRNWGCEYFVLTFRFETTRFQSDTTDTNFWVEKAVQMLMETEKGLQDPSVIKQGTQALSRYKNIQIGDEMDYAGGDLREFITVDRIQKITDKKYAIEISFATGPL